MNFGFPVSQTKRKVHGNSVWRERIAVREVRRHLLGMFFSRVWEDFRSNPFSNALNIQMHKYKLGMPHLRFSLRLMLIHGEGTAKRHTGTRPVRLSLPGTYSSLSPVSQWSPILFMQFWFGLLLARGQEPYLKSCWICLWKSCMVFSWKFIYLLERLIITVT